MQHSQLKLARLGLLLALVTGLLGALGAAPAQAADEGYRYWGVYELKDGKWKYATEGPSTAKIADRGVYGFRFATTTGTQSRPPRDAAVTFDRLCGDEKAEGGNAVVAIVLDYGRPADSASGSDNPPAPRAKCVQARPGSTLLAALKRAGDVRTDPKGMVCGVDGYPAAGCADPVKSVSAEAKAKDEPLTIGLGEAPSKETQASGTTSASPSATPSTPEGTDNGPSNATLAGIALVALLALALAAVYFMRRIRAREAQERRLDAATSRTPAAPSQAAEPSGSTREDHEPGADR